MKFKLLQTFYRDSDPYGVFLMDNESEQQQRLFMDSFYKSFGFKEQLNLDWFKWFYTKNPLGFCNNYILVDLKKDSWIGGFGFSKKSYNSSGRGHVGGLAVNGFVNSGYEGRGLYTDLISTGLNEEDYTEKCAFSFPHNKNLASIKGHLKSGWKKFVSLQFIEINIDGIWADDRRVINLQDPKILKNIDFSRFCLIEENKIFVRNYSELAWRYIDRPDKKYFYLMENSNSATGYMIIGSYSPRDGSRRFQIADFRYSSLDVLRRLIQKAGFIASEKKYQVLDVLINPASNSCEVFKEYGFVARDEGYEMLIYTNTQSIFDTSSAVNFGDFDVV